MNSLCCSRALLACCLLLSALPDVARAQAGPPLITNDPDTPGDGQWEINLAVAGSRSARIWDLSAPDVDINYGWGERVQLSVHLPWNHSRDNGWASGTGPLELAVRWRFLDEEHAGLSMAIQPHWSRSWSEHARRIGLAPVHDEFSLPLQVSRHAGDAVVGLEVGRNFIASEPDEWQAGIFWSRDCASNWQCLAEVNTIWAGGDVSSTLNLGGRRSLGKQWNLLGSFGRVFSGAGPGATIFYLGLQYLYPGQ